MRGFLKTQLLLGLVIVAVGYGLGSRIELDETIRQVTLPDDLDVYLKESERRIEGIKPGMEKTIVWADSEQRQATPYSIVYLHGFSAPRQEIAPLCELVAGAVGANLFIYAPARARARRQGHGEALRQWTAQRCGGGAGNWQTAG